MKIIRYYICSIVLLLSLASCKKENITDPALPILPAPSPTPALESDIQILSAINYGTSGMGNIIYTNELKIEGLNGTLFKIDGMPNSGTVTKVCKKSFTESDIDEIRKLLHTEKMKLLPEVIGCPICAGGEERVEVVADGKTYKFKFSYSEVPKEIKAAVLKIRLLRQSFDDCK